MRAIRTNSGRVRIEVASASGLKKQLAAANALRALVLTKRAEGESKSKRKPIDPKDLSFHRQGEAYCGSGAYNYQIKHKGRRIGSAYVKTKTLHPTLPAQVANINIKESHSGRGVAKAFYDHIEHEHGIKLAPDQNSLSARAYKFWKKRDPESVKNHEPIDPSDPQSTYWIKPKHW